MFNRLRKSTAVLLCAAICMTAGSDLYAAERGAGAARETVIETEMPEQVETDISVKIETPIRTETVEKQETESEAGKNPEAEIKTETAEKTETETKTETEFETTETPESEIKEEASENPKTEIETEFEAEKTEAPETETETEIESETETESETAILSEPESDHNTPPPGYIDDEFAAERLGSGQNQARLYALRNSIPAKYSAVEAGYATSVKDQGSWGSCWAFAAVAAAESAYKRLTGKEADMSETHLINFLYNDDLAGPDGGLEGDKVIPSRAKVDNGGNGMYTTFAMARWTGVADEAADKSLVYPNPDETKAAKTLNIPQKLAYQNLVHMQNAYWINKADVSQIKAAVMEYGAVLISYKDDSGFRSSKKGGYTGPTVYYNYTANPVWGTNHAVSLVGWDDNFDRNQFRHIENNSGNSSPSLPKENGAWLIKNSWGPEADDDGYFWMSYEDTSISDTVFAFDYEKADNYGHIYQYDGAVGTKYELSENDIKAAAVYQSTGYQLIQAVGVGIASAQTDYKIDIYTGLSDQNNPQSGTLCSSVSGKTTFQGYHTIRLEEPVDVDAGERFGIVVTLSGGIISDKYRSAIFLDMSYKNGTAVEFVAKTNPGETFSIVDGEWRDAKDKGTYRIKAYTSDVITEKMVESAVLAYTGEVQDDLAIKNGDVRLEKGKDYNITFDRAPLDVGSYKATVTGRGIYTGKIEITVSITPYGKTITEEMVESTLLAYTGDVQDDLVIKSGDVRLEKDKDYKIAFNKTPLNVGSYTAAITGIGNYDGEITVKISVAKIIGNDYAVTVSKAVYSGKALAPSVSVKLGRTTLRNGRDYAVSYENNTQAADGTGENAPRAVITGIGNYAGQTEKAFAILPKEISESSISAQLAYGEKESKLHVFIGNTELAEGTDYSVSEICRAETKDAVNMAGLAAGGKYNVSVALIGNYKVKGKDTALKKNIVCRQDINSLDISFRDPVEYTYDARAKKPRLWIRDAAGKTVSGSNYACLYVNNTNAGEAEVVVRGRGKYSGVRRMAFTINKKKIEGKTLGKKVIQEIKPQTFAQKEICPAVKVMDGRMVLKAGAGKDYTCEYANNVNVSYDKDGNVAAAAYVRIHVSGNYEIDDADAVEYFKINPAKITSVSPAKAYYTGEAVLPETAVKAGRLEVPERYYTVSAAGNNINASSSARLTVAAKPRTNYTGEKTVKYRILKK